MGPLVVVQNNFAVDRLTAPVSRHARAVGLDLVDLDLNEGFSFADAGLDLSDRDAVLLHGSVGFLRAALRDPDLAPHLAWSPEAFSALAWQDAFGDAYVGHRGRVLSATDVAQALAGGDRLAVRPEIGLKAFPGGVHDLSSWQAAGVDPDVSCFAMPPSILVTEHRVWFVGGEPVAASRYMAEGRVGGSRDGCEEAMEEAGRIAGRHLPLDRIVMDVALTPVGWKAVEFNCIHTSGWYAADVGTVVDALAAYRPDASPSPIR